MDQSLLLNVSYEFFSLLSRFTTASSLACVAVVSVRFLLGQARQAGKTREAKKEQKRSRRTGGGWGGGGGEGGGRKETVSFPSPPLPIRVFFPLASFCAGPSRPKGNGNDFYAAYKLP